MASMLTRASIVLLTAVALAPAPAQAAVVAFGPDLGPLTANGNALASCASGTPTPIPSGVGGSCMWSFIAIGTGAASLAPPASGTVTAVRVKVGPVTGRMRVNVIRFLFRQTGDTAHPFSAGPFLEAYGPEFTPQPNTITTVPVNLPVTEDTTPALNDLTTIQSIDALALEVETPNTPIPLYSAPGVLSYFSYPGPTAAGVPAPSPNGIAGATSGYGVLMNADLDTGGGATNPPPPATTGGGGGGGGGTAQPAPQANATLGHSTANVRNNALSLPIQCLVLDCSGTVTLVPAAKGARAAASVTYGSAHFSAKAGKTRSVKVKLNTRGRALLKHRKRIAITARISLTGQAQAITHKLTLKRGH